jgi:hypothetical protein
VERTESASPAYIKELLRKAAVLAVTGGAGVVLQDEHVERAAEEVSLGGRLGLRIMGFQGAAAASWARATQSLSARSAASDRADSAADRLPKDMDGQRRGAAAPRDDGAAGHAAGGGP